LFDDARANDRGLYGSPYAGQELAPDVSLERAHLLRHRGCRQIQSAGSVSDGAAVDHGHEALQEACIHTTDFASSEPLKDTFLE
jgi:hypothetical protein